MKVQIKNCTIVGRGSAFPVGFSAENGCYCLDNVVIIPKERIEDVDALLAGLKPAEGPSGEGPMG